MRSDLGHTSHCFCTLFVSVNGKLVSILPYHCKHQAYHAFSLRNKFRTAARKLMANREAAEKLYKTDPNRTWKEIVQRQVDKGLTGDDIYRAIIQSSQRSRSSVNKSLGLE